MNLPTRPAPSSEPESSRSGASVPGTIGFDLYLALFTPRAVLALAKLPSDLLGLIHA